MKAKVGTQLIPSMTLSSSSHHCLSSPESPEIDEELALKEA
jgi:hypothetical protein